MMLTRSFFALICFASLLSCSKKEQPAGPGLESRIQEFQSYACSGGRVTRYDFQDTYAFVFSTGCKGYDLAAMVYDAYGNQICMLGGIAGNLSCRGSRFGEVAVNPVVIYTKP